MIALRKMDETDQSDADAAPLVGKSILSRLRATCVIAIDAFKCAPASKELAILMLVYRLQDHIALITVRDATTIEDTENSWVDRWRPE